VIAYKVYPPFQIGPFSIYPWGIMVSLGFILGGWLFLAEAKKKKIPADAALNIILIALVGAVLGARLWVVFEYLGYFVQHPLEILAVWKGGMAFWGGFLVSLGLVCLYLKKKNLNFGEVSDSVAPSLALGMFLGRIGNFLSGHHLGIITNLPWGIEYLGTVRHPASLYEALNALLLFLALLLLRSKVKRKGVLFLVFLFWYSGVRFGLDFLRNSDLPTADPRYFGHLTGAQMVCMVILAVVSFWVVRIKIKSQKQRDLTPTLSSKERG